MQDSETEGTDEKQTLSLKNAPLGFRAVFTRHKCVGYVGQTVLKAFPL